VIYKEVKSVKKIVVFGSGGHAKVVIDVIRRAGEYDIYGIVDGFRSQNEMVYGYEVIGDESSLLPIKDNIHGGIVAVGDNWIRRKIVEKVKAIIPDFLFICAIHPSAIISEGVTIREGTVVAGGVVINSNVHIGEHCIINTHSSIDHDCVIDNYATIAPGATIGGNVKIGIYSVISLGANVIHSITIGEHTVVGAGATVVKDIGSYAIAFGVPATKIKSREKGDKYL
jgi:sugar O-acyltransferase (sialic acid O-acetyltransferase NeuD family)